MSTATGKGSETEPSAGNGKEALKGKGKGKLGLLEGWKGIGKDFKGKTKMLKGKDLGGKSEMYKGKMMLKGKGKGKGLSSEKGDDTTPEGIADPNTSEPKAETPSPIEPEPKAETPSPIEPHQPADTPAEETLPTETTPAGTSPPGTATPPPDQEVPGTDASKGAVGESAARKHAWNTKALTAMDDTKKETRFLNRMFLRHVNLLQASMFLFFLDSLRTPDPCSYTSIYSLPFLVPSLNAP